VRVISLIWPAEHPVRGNGYHGYNRVAQVGLARNVGVRPYGALFFYRILLRYIGFQYSGCTGEFGVRPQFVRTCDRILWS
jgi:hypothetical protein